MSGILNVLGKCQEYLKYSVISPEQHERGDLPGAPPPSKAKAAKPQPKPDPEARWQDELEYMERIGVGSLPSAAEAAEAAKKLEDQTESEARELAESAKKSRQLASAEAFSLSAVDRSELLRQADKLEERARDLKANMRCKIAQAKDFARKCREWGPSKPRLRELRERKAHLDSLLADTSKVETAKI